MVIKEWIFPKLLHELSVVLRQLIQNTTLIAQRKQQTEKQLWDNWRTKIMKGRCYQKDFDENIDFRQLMPWTHGHSAVTRMYEGELRLIHLLIMINTIHWIIKVRFVGFQLSKCKEVCSSSNWSCNSKRYHLVMRLKLGRNAR